MLFSPSQNYTSGQVPDLTEKDKVRTMVPHVSVFFMGGYFSAAFFVPQESSFP
jgi:hypothetical protein